MNHEQTPPRMNIIALCALISGSFFVGSMLTIVIPILPDIADGLWDGSVGKLPVQLLIAVPMAGLVCGGLLSTVVFARWHARTVLIGGMIVFGIAGSVGIFGNATALVVSRFIIGVCSACIAAASTSLIGEFVTEERRPRVLGAQMAGASVMGVLAMLASGAISDAYGWRASFALFPMIALLGVSGASLAPKSALVKKMPQGPSGPGLRSQLLSLWPVLLFVFLLNTTAFTTNSQATFVLADQGIGSAGGRAQIMGINQVMIVMAAIAFPVVRKWVGQKTVPIVVLFLMGGGLITLGISQSVVQAAMALGLLGIGNGLLFPFQSSMLLQHASAEARGAGAGLMVSAQFIADAINPLVLGPLILSIGLHETIVIVGIAALLAAGLWGGGRGLRWIAGRGATPRDAV
ncbi:hypothetical protein MB02_07340 [Croceicoccus estronivorus]|uniref:MFS transporter n=1 Tax=Croceicoccus estronivorus TaxID=1172626 RepID=UPI00083635A2|nr:MFS transporter [Croceicoccus estronivorus]OCC24387.1 hypothetical protein MB02_07340 [Croceicoccus estronivorus]